jgi:two-component system CheB/CheR fusion protein
VNALDPVDSAPPASVEAGARLLPIVGIGASAGGLEAFEKFFRACPAHTGMAFVLVPHLDPDHPSLLAEILQRITAMPVLDASDRMVVLADHVYIIPPNREMSIRNGVLLLSVPSQARGQRLPIDGFLRSLAEDRAEKAIGIVLSGTASDGTLGLRAILGANGVCMVQEPASARYDGMPQSAIAAGYVTHILPPEEMPAMLLDLNRQSDFHPRAQRILPPATLSGVSQVLLQVRHATGHDFSLYKKHLIVRRIERRMALQGIENMGVYARFLKTSPVEIQALYHELLINVTSFFRDPQAFEALKEEVLARLLADKPVGEVFRVWVPACASGEEAYSIAILLRELMDERRCEIKVQIFATDLDAEVVMQARKGVYPASIAPDVRPERLTRFFTPCANGYKVNKSLREMLVFAEHSVIKDPPFTQLDLLSCRNLLIYLEAELQANVLATFHYALNPGGILFLSTSESIGRYAELFSVIDRQWKFYRVAQVPATSRGARFGAGMMDKTDPTAPAGQGGQRPARLAAEFAGRVSQSNIATQSNRLLLSAYAPASVTTDASGNILYIHGDVSRYLCQPPGPVTGNVVDMARAGLQFDLRLALINAAGQGKPTLGREVAMQRDGVEARVSLSVRLLPAPQSAAGGRLLLVSFQEVVEPGALENAVEKTFEKALENPLENAVEGAQAANAPRSRRKLHVAPATTARLEYLERELAYARENLQATIEYQQQTNEQLGSLNEELKSTNEELQSSNEELETTQEHLRSLNAAAGSVNAELGDAVEQLRDMGNEMKNLLDNVTSGTLFLDRGLRIQRYTKEALKVFHLVASDVGRPLSHIKSNLVEGVEEGGDLLAQLHAAIETLIPATRELCTKDGSWFQARMVPYRTVDNIIEGVVLSFSDISEARRASEALRRSNAILGAAQEIAHLGSWEFDVASGAQRWSSEMFRLFGYPPVDTPMSLDAILNTLVPAERERVGQALQAAIANATPYDVEYRIKRPDGALRDLRARATPVLDGKGCVMSLLGATLDVTAVREAERVKLAAVQLARELAEGIVSMVREPLIVLDGDLAVVSANASFYRIFQLAPPETLGRRLYDLQDGQWRIPALRHLLENILPKDQAMEGYVLEHSFPGLGARHLLLNARRIVTALGNTHLILLTIERSDLP